MANLLQDLRMTWRMLRKNPGYTAVAIVILGLGIGANTAIFSAVNGLLLRPLPYPDPERLVQIWETDRRRDQVEGPVSPLNLEDWREASAGFAAMAGYSYEAPVLRSGDAPKRLTALAVSTSFFRVLGVEPLLGRALQPGDDESRVVVLSHGLWQDGFGGDPGVVGQTLNLDGRPYTVVGVMPPGFRFPRSALLWMPLTFDPAISRGHHFLFAVGRLNRGSTLEATREEMDAIARRLEERYPDTNQAQGVRIVPLRDQLVGDFRLRLLILSGAVALVLLVGCANVANLLLVRATARRREVALRSALGATRGRLARQFLVEALTLALAAGALGVVLADLGLDLLLAVNPFSLPIAEPIALDGRVLGFALLASSATGVVFGVVPAWLGSSPGGAAALRQVASTANVGSQRLRRRLVSAEIALAVILLAGAGLLARSFQRMSDVDPGFVTEGRATMKLELTGQRYGDGRTQAEVASRIVQRLMALPDVEAAGAVDDLPFSGSRSSGSFELERGEPGASDALFADARSVTPGYLRAMGVKLLAGRGLESGDTRESSQVAVVNETFAERFLGAAEPVGQRIRIGGPREEAMYGGPVWREIVGVVADLRHDDLTRAPRPEIYTPFAQRPSTRVSLVVATKREASEVVSSVRSALREVLPDEPLFDVRTMEDRVADSIAVPRFHAGLLSAFAGFAVLLAALGIYGVVAYAVRQRTREIGIRIALGAHGRTISRHIVSGSLLDIGTGLGVGIAGALLLSRALGGVLFGVSPHDPVVYAGVVVLFGFVGLLASYAPARRAARVDPVEALREQ